MGKICGICGCRTHRDGDYAKPTVKGRSHVTEHHYVAERFFGRSKNRPHTQRPAIFRKNPWELDENTSPFCYECHEELLHNPVFLPADIDRFRALAAARGLGEVRKAKSRGKIARRIMLLHEVIDVGLRGLTGMPAESGPHAPSTARTGGGRKKKHRRSN